MDGWLVGWIDRWEGMTTADGERDLKTAKMGGWPGGGTGGICSLTAENHEHQHCDSDKVLMSPE